MALGTQAQSRGKLLDYEQYIDHQLRRTRSQIKKVDVITAGLMLATVAFAIFFLEVILDHALSLPLWVRRIILFIGGAAGIAYASIKIVRPLIANVNGMYAAKTIESSEPGFNNGLINYLALKKDRENLPKSFLAAIEAKAVSQLTHVDVEGVVNQKRVLKTAYVLSAIVVVFCIYSVFGPKSIWDSTKRAFLADVAPPTNTKLVNMEPGFNEKGMKIVAGSPVVFTVEVEGSRPENVILHYSIDGGDFFAEQEVAPGKNLYDRWQTTLRNLQRSVDYYMTGGDARTDTYHIEVLPAPLVTSVTLDYDFPAYTGVANRKAVEGGTIDVIEGTLVTVHAKTSEPAVDGKLNLIGKNTSYSMLPKQEDPQEIIGKFLVAENGSYTITFRTTSLQPNPEPVVYEIVARKDFPPTAKILKPASSIKLPANGKVAVIVEASDDFGIKDVFLTVHEGTNRVGFNNLVLPPLAQRKLTGSFDLDLPKLTIPPKPGARLQYWVTVRDTKEPQPNKVETTKYEIEVIDPVRKDEIAKLEKTADQEKKEADEANKAQQGEAREELAQNDPGENRPDNGDPTKEQKGDGADQKGDGKPGDDRNQIAMNDQAKEPKAPPNNGDEQPNNGENEAEKPNEQDRNKMKELERMLKSQSKLGKNPPNGKPQEGNAKSDPKNTEGANQDQTPPAAESNPANPSAPGREGVSSPDRKTGTQPEKSNKPADQDPSDKGTNPANPADQVSRSQPQPNDPKVKPETPDRNESSKGTNPSTPGGAKAPSAPDPKRPQNQPAQGPGSSTQSDNKSAEAPQNKGAKPGETGKTDPANSANPDATKSKSGEAPNEGTNPAGKPGNTDPAKAENDPSKGPNQTKGNDPKGTNDPQGPSQNSGDPKKPNSDQNGTDGKSNAESRAGVDSKANSPESDPAKPSANQPPVTGEKPKSNADSKAGQDKAAAGQDPKDPSEAIKPGEKSNDPKNANPGDPATQKPEPGEAKPNGENGPAKPGEEKPNGENGPAKPGEAKPNGENGAAKPGEAKPGEAKPNGENGPAKPGEAKPNGENGPAKPGEAKPNGENGPAKPGEAKPDGENGAAKPGEAKPNGENGPAKPGEAKPNGENGPAKPGEAKPNGENGPAKPGEAKPNGENGAAKPGEAKPGEAKPDGENGPAKPGEAKPNGENGPAKPGEEKPNGENGPAKPGEQSAQPPKPGENAAQSDGSGDPSKEKMKGGDQAKSPAPAGAKPPGAADSKPGEKGTPESKPNGEGEAPTPGEKSAQNPKPGAGDPAKEPQDPGTSDPGKQGTKGSDQAKPSAPEDGKPPGSADSGQPEKGMPKPGDVKPGDPAESPTGTQTAPPDPSADPSKAKPAPAGTDPSQAKPTKSQSQATSEQGKPPGQSKPEKAEASKKAQSKPEDSEEGSSGKPPEPGKPGSGGKEGAGGKGESSPDVKSASEKGSSSESKTGGGKPDSEGEGTGEGKKPGEGAGGKPSPGSSPEAKPGNPQSSNEPGGADAKGSKSDPNAPPSEAKSANGSKPGESTQPGGKPSSEAGPGKPGEGNDPSQQKNAPKGKGTGTNSSGGGDGTPGSPPGAPMEDKSVPPPDSSGQVPEKSSDSIAPDTQGSNLVIRTIQDLLKNDKVTPEVEKQFDMTRDQMEQFVKKFEKGKPREAAGPAREIKVGPNAPERTFDPNRKAPEGLPTASVSDHNQRSGTSLKTDDMKGLAVGSQVAAPKALGSRWNAYKTSVGRSTVGSKRPSAPASK